MPNAANHYATPRVCVCWWVGNILKLTVWNVVEFIAVIFWFALCCQQAEFAEDENANNDDDDVDDDQDSVLGVISVINLMSNKVRFAPRSCHLYIINTHARAFNGLFSRTTWVSRYQKGKTNLDFTEARDSEWQWHQLGHMQVCTSLQTNNHASPHHSVFYRPDALPAAQPTVSKHWRQFVYC